MLPTERCVRDYRRDAARRGKQPYSDKGEIKWKKRRN